MPTESTPPAPATDPSTQAQETAETTDSTRQPTTSPNKRRRRNSSVHGSDSRRRSASPEPLKTDHSTSRPIAGEKAEENPPLPDEEPPKASEEEDGEIPPLPEEAPPEDDGWEPVWEPNAQTYYFYNRFTQRTQWENPRVPHANAAASNTAPGTDPVGAPGTSSPPRRLYGGYNPAIHGSYDPNADYAKQAEREAEQEEAASSAAYGVPNGAMDPNNYAASAHFNRFTGRFQTASINSENYNDENKSRRQMSAFFDVDAAANSHDGRSLKAERQGKKLTKQEVRAFREKRREKKEEKRRAWLKD